MEKGILDNVTLLKPYPALQSHYIRKSANPSVCGVEINVSQASALTLMIIFPHSLRAQLSCGSTLLL